MKHPIKVSSPPPKPVLRKKVKVGDIVTCKWGSPFGVIVKVLAADKWRMIEACRVRWIDDPHGLGEEFSADLKVISRG